MAVCNRGNPVQYPIINKAGSTKMTADRVPAADACV